MMQEEIIVSGFGGQGTLFAGQVLALAAMDHGHQVTWIPSYGPEMRGGKARCTTIISDETIGSPVVRRPSLAIVMNIPSMEAFAEAVKPEGVLVVNSSLVPQRCEREDIRALHIPATEVATEMGEVRLANMICLGALMQARPVVTPAQILEALEAHLPSRHRALLGLNRDALERGAALASAALSESSIGGPR
ncbi:MAG: 2-oxoacid:acceptor oxidoreductase family protein [Myxococcales bacterium]|nr:2-oxoacid:acceptor oxidoreductase family protein [Myxococcales bacterium]